MGEVTLEELKNVPDFQKVFVAVKVLQVEEKQEVKQELYKQDYCCS